MHYLRKNGLFVDFLRILIYTMYGKPEYWNEYMKEIDKRIKTCSFFGHRKINTTDELKQNIKTVIQELILNHNVCTFLFGSRSDFNSLCHLIVDELKQKYPNIKRIAYTCQSETCTLESEREKQEKIHSYFEKRNGRLLCVEEEFEHKTKYSAGKASYIERNQAMIDNSDYCIFYYDGSYKPKMRKCSKKSFCYYQPNSGTKLAYKYAIKKNKNIINIKNLP